MNGISMLILSVGGIIAVLFFVTYAAQKHDLNGIKDKTVGNGQHGTARWATRQEVKQTYHHVPYTPNQWRQAAKEGKQHSITNGTMAKVVARKTCVKRSPLWLTVMPIRK